METASEKFQQETNVSSDKMVQIMELTMHHLTASGGLEPREFLARADAIMACGFDVLISNYFEYYRLASYLARFSKQKIALAMGLRSLQSLFDEKYYRQLEGGILESLGRLFKNDLKLYIYPIRDPESGEIITLDKIQIAPDIEKLYSYLVDKGNIVALENYDPECLEIYTRDVLDEIQSNQPEWEDKVPEEVVDLIKERRYFGYSPE